MQANACRGFGSCLAMAALLVCFAVLAGFVCCAKDFDALFEAEPELSDPDKVQGDFAAPKSFP